MTKTTIALTFATLVLSLAGPGAHAAQLTEFTGSRADVRAFCTAEGDHLLEGGRYSLCTTPVTDVMCRDDGVCSSSDLELAFAAGFQRIRTAEAPTR